MSPAWVWIDPRVVLAVHEEQLLEHGGATAVRDQGLFESALAKPLNLASYGQPDAADLAAAYGCGLARNHPYVDGNKRTPLVAMELFLRLNGLELEADDADCLLTMLAMADGSLGEAAFAAWLRGRLAPAS